MILKRPQISSWAGDSRPRRRVRFDTPRGVARCEECGEKLSYEYGSIAWSCRERDLCPTCWGKQSAERILEKMRNRLTHPTP